MAEYILDASIAISWFFRDEGTEHTRELLRRLSADADTAISPSHMLAEISNGLLVAQRRGRLEEGEPDDCLEHLSALPITLVHPTWSDMRRVYTLAAEEMLAAYDALYVDLALQWGLPLATLDRKMRSVADELGISRA